MKSKTLSPVLWIKLGAIAVLLGYLYVLVKIILFRFSDVNVPLLARLLREAADQPQNVAYRLQFANLTPFASIRQNMAGLPRTYDVVNLFGNMALFVPLGLLLGLFVRCRLPAVLVCAFGVSLMLESAQLILAMGSFDVDDLLLNTLGAGIGYGLLASAGWAGDNLSRPVPRAGGRAPGSV